MKEELKIEPCPYCDNTQIDYYNVPYASFFGCSSCGLCGPRELYKDNAALAWNVLPRRLRLEKNDCAPEEPGNYWFRHPDWNGGEPFIVNVYHGPNPPSFTGERIVNVTGREYHIDNEDAELFEGGEWAGPIQEPEEP